MFNETQKEGYRRIALPEELRGKVQAAVQAEKPEKRPLFSFRVLVPALACLALVLSIFLVQPGGLTLKTGDLTLSTAGAVLPEDPMEPRTMALEPEKTLELDAGRPVEILPGDGTASCDPQGIIRWSVPLPDSSRDYRLNLQDGKKQYTVILHYEAEENCFTIRCETT